MSKRLVKAVICQGDWHKEGRLCDFSFLSSSGFNLFDGGFLFDLDGNIPIRELRKIFPQETKKKMRELKDKGILTFIYVDITRMSREKFPLSEAKKFMAVEKDGSPNLIFKGRSYGACYNNPEWLKFIVETATFYLEESGADGIQYDIIQPFRDCFCPYCEEKFSQEVGKSLREVPSQRGERNWKIRKLYLEWRLKNFIQFLRKLENHIRKKTGKPFLRMGTGHVRGGKDPLLFLHGVYDFFLFEEPWTYPPQNNVFAYKLAHALNTVGLVVTRVKEGIPTPSMLRVALAEGAAFGGNFTPWGFYIHESKDLEKVCQEHNQFIEKTQEWFGNMEDEGEVGIIYSPTSHLFYEWELQGRKEPHALYFAQILLDLHIPFRILIPEKGEEKLDKFKLLILPDVGILSSNWFRLLKDYVEKGGRIISTGNSAFYDESLERRKEKLEGDNVIQLPSCPEKDYVINRFYGPDYINLIRPPSPELTSLIFTALPDPCIKTEAPSTLLLNLRRRGKRWVLHLVNSDCNRGHMHLWLKAVKGVRIKLKLPGEIKRVENLTQENTNVTWSKEGEYLQISIPVIHHYAGIGWELK